MLDHNIDDDFDPTKARKTLANGGIVPLGKYHVRLESAQHRRAGNTSLTELKFQILEGEYTGEEVLAQLWHSDKKANGNRILLAKSCLGMIVREPGTKKWIEVQGKQEFACALGLECIVEVEHEKYKSSSGKEITRPVVTFGGFWAVDDPEARGVKKATKADAPAPRPKVNTANI